MYMYHCVEAFFLYLDVQYKSNKQKRTFQKRAIEIY